MKHKYWKIACAELMERVLLSIPLGNDAKEYMIYEKVRQAQLDIFREYINQKNEVNYEI